MSSEGSSRPHLYSPDWLHASRCLKRNIGKEHDWDGDGDDHLCQGGVAGSLPPLSNGILQVLRLLTQLLQFVHRAPRSVH